MGCSTEKEYQWDTASAILNTLLKNLKEFELLTKPSAIRENKLFTINSNNVSLESVKCDDNGSYLSKGTATKFYYWESDKEEPPCSTHFNRISQTWLIKQSTRSNYYENIQVEQEKVCEIRRAYRQNKNNPQLTQYLSTIKPVSVSSYNSYCLVIYKVNRDKKETFITPRYGNAVHSHAPSYYRQDPSVKTAINEKLNQGWLTEKIYVNLTESESTLSETTKNPKVIDNRKYKQKEKLKDISGTQSEAEIIVNYLKKDDDFVKSLNLIKDEYNTLDFIQEQLWDVYRF